MKRVLVEVIARYAIFLEFSGEDVLDLNAAVQQQEDLVFRMQKLSGTERAEFIRLLKEVADATQFQDQREYLHRLPEMLGL
jgi:hypothetical protein